MTTKARSPAEGARAFDRRACRSVTAAERLTLDGVVAVELVPVGRPAVELVVAGVVARDVLVTVLVDRQLVRGVVPGRLELGAAHGALAMTTPGDTSMATVAEVRALAGGGSARVRR